MRRKVISGIILTLLLMAMLTLAFDIQFVIAKPNPILNQDSGAPLIYVLIDASIYDDISFHIDRYLSDVERIGFNATVVLFSEGNHEDVRAILVNARSEGLVGCLLVGDIPAAIFEDWEVDDEAYPVDLFYMDLDGIWADTDSNGKYDQHTGDRTPEIWVGRIKVPSAARDEEVSLIQNYFDKNHDYRTGVMYVPDRALIYIDDDWRNMRDDMDDAVSLIYDDRTLVDKQSTTTAEDYLERLSKGWSLVHLMVHGSSSEHNFDIYEQSGGFVTWENITSIDPPVFFYSLFSCSNAKYTHPNYIAGWYIFCDTYGLAAISSTESGGMLHYSEFYSKFKEETLGFSFKDWLTKRIAAEDEGDSYNWAWFYGMTILGDPTLSVKPETEEVDIAVTDIDPCMILFSDNDPISFNVTTKNQGYEVETFNVTLYFNENPIGTETVTLYPRQSRTITFFWDRTGSEYGNYTLNAYAHLQGETDSADNTFYGWIVFAIPEDLNGDGKVDIRDVTIVALAFGTMPGFKNWKPIADLNEDAKVNIRDVTIVAMDFGKTL